MARLSHQFVDGSCEFCCGDEETPGGHPNTSECPALLRAAPDRALAEKTLSIPTIGQMFRVTQDWEFTILEECFTRIDPELTTHLKETTHRIAGQDHNCFTWISIHSDFGAESGGVEAEHFEAAMEGAREALRYTPPGNRDDLREQILLGVGDFARDHYEFFTHVNT